MAPHVASSSSDRKASGPARFLGAASAGVLELLGFHPVDTVAKRLMTSQKKIFSPGVPFSQSMATLNSVVFVNAHDAPLLRKYFSLFPGLGFAAGYKILQRIYKFGGQPYVMDYLSRKHKATFEGMVGEGGNAKVIMQATAGSIVGIGEIVLLPLDVLKIKKQTNPEALKNRSFVSLLSEEGMGLYRGATWTAARNAPGSFALFGGAAMVKEYVFGLQDYSSATFFMNFCASIGGAISSIAVSAPLDVIKTRIQSRSFDSPQSGATIVRNMIRTEGFGSFFKGLTPKILVVGPKLVFSFTIAQQLIPIISNFLDGEKRV